MRNPRTKYKRSKTAFSVILIALSLGRIGPRLLQPLVQSLIGSPGTLTPPARWRTQSRHHDSSSNGHNKCAEWTSHSQSMWTPASLIHTHTPTQSRWTPGSSPQTVQSHLSPWFTGQHPQPYWAMFLGSSHKTPVVLVLVVSLLIQLSPRT